MSDDDEPETGLKMGVGFSIILVLSAMLVAGGLLIILFNGGIAPDMKKPAAAEATAGQVITQP